MSDPRVEIVEAKSVEEVSYDALFERMRLAGCADGLKPWSQLTTLERATWSARCAATRILFLEFTREQAESVAMARRAYGPDGRKT